MLVEWIPVGCFHGSLDELHGVVLPIEVDLQEIRSELVQRMQSRSVVRTNMRCCMVCFVPLVESCPNPHVYSLKFLKFQ